MERGGGGRRTVARRSCGVCAPSVSCTSSRVLPRRRSRPPPLLDRWERHYPTPQEFRLLGVPGGSAAGPAAGRRATAGAPAAARACVWWRRRSASATCRRTPVSCGTCIRCETSPATRSCRPSTSCCAARRRCCRAATQPTACGAHWASTCAGGPARRRRRSLRVTAAVRAARG